MKGCLCYQCDVIDMEITDGTDPIQVSYKEGYFCFECGNINVLFGRRNKSYGFMYI
jgi:hypothetical protein